MDQNDNVLFLKELPEFKKKDIKHKRVTTSELQNLSYEVRELKKN